MPAASKNLTEDDVLEAGATYNRTFSFVDENGDPLDLTDFDPQVNPSNVGGRMMFRTGVDEADPPLISLTKVTTPDTEGVYIVQPPTLGKIQVYIDEDTLATLSYDGSPQEDDRSGKHDLEVGDSATPPVVMRLMKGDFKVDPEVTR